MSLKQNKITCTKSFYCISKASRQNNKQKKTTSTQHNKYFWTKRFINIPHEKASRLLEKNGGTKI